MKPLHQDPLVILFILVWASGYLVGALAVHQAGPLAVTLWRFVGSAAILAGLAVVRRERWPGGRELWHLAAAGVTMFALQFGALYTSMAHGMPAPTVALIACSAPLLVAVVSAIARWERLTLGNWIGVGLGVLGVAVTLADKVGRPPTVGALLWALLGLAGLVTGTVAQGRIRHGAGPLSGAAVQVATGALVLAVWAPLAGPLGIPGTAPAIVIMAWLIVVAGVGAPLLMFELIRRRGATSASSLLFVVPAVTAFAAWPLLGTRVGGWAIAGLVIAAAGMLLVTRRAVRPRLPGRRVGVEVVRGPVRN